eukprot:CAMPEP_0119534394 /NCGR_PEP_ID=MMETSP1344-20130328/47628_1 /TAXON_ID=236787 /ORGANISM="Florenciella parvula, Strain CCMP2471" /LENGTH=742 /DNA_ID=CAMNT_0007575637 /DNA_START=146 /DNA_END=2371 /DNA_ORIENTATION=-
MAGGPGQLLLVLWLGFGGLWCQTGLAAIAQRARSDGTAGTLSHGGGESDLLGMNKTRSDAMRGERVGYETPSPSPRLVPAAAEVDEEAHRQLSHECPATCYGTDCDTLYAYDSQYTCATLEAYECDCSGCSCGGTLPPTPSDVGECYTLHMQDSYGDGWHGAVWTWREQGGDGQELKTGTLASGSSGTTALCTYKSIACYEFEVGGGADYPSEISWEVELAGGGGGVALWKGGAEANVATTVATCTAGPTMSPAPTAFACNVRFEGANDGLNTECLGLYEHQGLDANGVVYFKHATMEFFMYLEDGGEWWYVGPTLGSTVGWWVGLHVTNSPADVVTWQVWSGTEYVDQPNVTVTGVTGADGGGAYPPECWVYTPDPTSSPVPTMTANPTDARIFVKNDAMVRDAVEGAASNDNIVVKNDIALTDTLWFPEGLVGVALRGDEPGITLAGNGTFLLIDLYGSTEVILEDLILTGGYSEYGGAMLVGSGAVVWVRRCTLSLNRAYDAGGAVYIEANVVATFEDSLFELNEAVTGPGGAMYLYSNSRATILRTTFTKNKAGASGGGVGFSLNRPSKVDPSIVEDCLFDLNNATLTGGGMDVNSRFTTVHVSTTRFHHNYAGQRGGAVSGSADAVITVTDSIMANNAAGDAGGSAYATATSLTFDNVSVTDSVAGRAGGGVAITGDTSAGAFTSTSFRRCNASAVGGAVAAWSNVPELTIEGGAFGQCAVEEQGGALHIDGTGVLR